MNELPIKLNDHEVIALLNGGTMLLEKIDEDIKYEVNNSIYKDKEYYTSAFLETYSKLQLSKNYYVQEEFIEYLDDDEIASMGCAYDGDDSRTVEAKYMQPHQSRIRITPVKQEIKKLSELSIQDTELMTTFNPNVYSDSNQNRAYLLDFKDWYESQHGAYNENDNVVLHTLKVEI